jgi:two-component system NtrC family sensor kinase
MSDIGNAPSDFVGGAELRAILDASPSLIVYFDREHRYRYANPNYAQFIGQTVPNLLGRTILEILGPEIWGELEPHARKALAGSLAHHSGWVPHPDGTPRHLERTYSPHRDPDGRIVGYFVIVHDTTDLKHRERELALRGEELQASEAMNAAIIASALDCVIVIDESSRVVAFNPQAERTFGYPAAEAIGQSIDTLIVPPHLRERHARGFERYLKTGVRTVLGRRIEIEAMRGDGSVFPVELAITEVAVPGRRLFTAYLRDLTQARAAAAEIERQKESLYQREKLAALGSLLAGVAHELNNPLSIVIGQALMLQEETTEEERAPAEQLATRAQKIQTAAERCARIVRTFLAMARQRKAERRPVDLPKLVEGAVDLLGYGLRSAGVEIRCDWPAGLPPVEGDADQLHQVIVNLLINAQQAMEDQVGPRRIEIRGRFDPAARTVVATVADNGPGVADAIRQRVFEPYFTTKPIGVGTGVGLAVSRGMVEAHGGNLLLLPADPARPGARFEIHLPIADSTSAADATEVAHAGATDSASMDRRALIIDDEPGIAGLLAEILERDGFACHVASGGDEARRRLEASRYHVVLCDVHMPGEDGIAFFRWLRSNRPEDARRIVFVTGDTLGPTAGRFIAECGRPAVEKPFAPEEIRRIASAVASGA